MFAVNSMSPSCLPAAYREAGALCQEECRVQVWCTVVYCHGVHTVLCGVQWGARISQFRRHWLS